MTERRIFLSTDECAAIRAGRKTQFRREIEPQPHIDKCGNFCWGGGNFGQDTNGRPLAQSIASPVPDSKTGKVHCPFGKPGDRLWVPEGFALSVIDPDGLTPEDDPENFHVIYRTDPPGGGWMDDDGNPVDPPWQFAAAMPRWAARIVLEVISVRVERLRDISTKASGSALRYYSCERKLSDMREAMRQLLSAAYIAGSNDNFKAMTEANERTSKQ